MNQIKVGDKVPKDKYAYFVVQTEQKPKKDKNNWEDYSNYKKGQTIIVQQRDIEAEIGGYVQSFRDFLQNNCRTAIPEETDMMYQDEFSNAIVSDVYDDGSYGISYYYVPTIDLDILSIVNEQDYWTKYRKKKDFFKKIGLGDSVSDTTGFRLDEKGQFIQKEYFGSSKKILKTCRKATPEEAKQFNDEVTEMWRIRREQQRLEEEAKEKAKQERYEANKNNAEYFPGSCGNYKQVIINKNGKIDETKLYDLYTIKQFYDELIKSDKIDKALLEKLVLYGGTVPYIMLDTKDETRKFGDVDIFIPIENMAMFRQCIMGKSYFNMTFDSMNLTRSAGLRAEGSKMFSQPWFMGDSSDMSSYNEYERRVARARDEHRSETVYQDYGFKGSLFDVNISVFPIYQWDKNNALDICAKSFRVGKEEGDNKFLLNTVVTHNTPTSSFSRLVEMCGGVIGTANLEYTIASKRSAINHGYLLRQETDLRDLEFIEQNKARLSINDSLVQHYEENIPDYGIAKVYRITRSNEVQEYTPEEYRHIVTRNHKPS